MDESDLAGSTNVLSLEPQLVVDIDETRKASIRKALDLYRETVFNHNYSLLKFIIDDLEAQTGEPDWSPDYTRKARMCALGKDFLSEAIFSLADSTDKLLDPALKEDLRVLYSLDGVLNHKSVDLEKVARWASNIKDAISELKPQMLEQGFVLPQDLVIQMPADLLYLLTIAPPIIGTRRLEGRGRQQTALVDGVENSQTPQAAKKRVLVPLHYNDDDYDPDRPTNDLSSAWLGESIAVAVELAGGDMCWAGSYALFCEVEENGWAWRYGMQDELWDSPLFDSVEDYLTYYAHFEEMTEDEVKKEISSIKSLHWRPTDTFSIRNHGLVYATDKFSYGQ